MTLPELIAALEAAPGPSRELDAWVMFKLYAKPVGVHKIDGGPSGYLWPEDNPSWSFGIRFPGKDRDWFAKSRNRKDKETLLVEDCGALVLMNSLRVPKLTASIETALSLVPGAWRGAVSIDFLELQHTGTLAYATNGDSSDPLSSVCGTHKVPAIAICIMALKARNYSK